MAVKVVFFGTPSFSVPTLQTLLQDDRFAVVAVVSQPDKPVGRGQQLQPTPVKSVALEANIPVFQPVSIRKDEGLLDTLRQLQADVFVTIAFGQILNQGVLDIPRLGTVNVHASLLPKYRGASPIQWAIINGETETGLTTMLTDIGVDTGDMLLKAVTPIAEDDTAVTLSDRLSQMGGPLLVDTLWQLYEGTLKPQPQDHENASHARKMTKEDALLDGSKTAQAILHQIRGQQPWPGAQIDWQGQPLKVLHARVAMEKIPAGQLTRMDGKPPRLLWGTASQALELLHIQPPGKKVMNAADWLRGLPAGAI